MVSVSVFNRVVVAMKDVSETISVETPIECRVKVVRGSVVVMVWVETTMSCRAAAMPMKPRKMKSML